MAEKFDPYYTWLGIPPEDQPPDHYALLGVRQFESNHDVISNLTDQRMAHVKTFQAGPHGADSQKLLNEIAAARVCLLNPEKRKTYDARLRDQIALATAPESPPLAAPEIISPLPIEPPLIAPPTSAAQSDSVSEAFAFIEAKARPLAAGGDLAVKKAVQSRAKQRARARWLFILAPILGITAVAAAIMIRNSQDTDDVDPAAVPKRATTALAPGGQKLSPAHGPSPSGKPPIAKSQENTERGERLSDLNPPARQEATIPPKPDDPTAVVGNTESSSHSPQNLPANDGSAMPASAPAAPSEGQFPLGEWVDVLRLVDTNSKMVVAGNWSRNGNEINVEPGVASRIAIPVVVNGSYDFEVEFTRTAGIEGVCAMVSIGSHPCRIALGGWTGRVSGLDDLNGYLANDPRNPIAVRPGNLQNDYWSAPELIPTTTRLSTCRSMESPTCHIGAGTQPRSARTKIG